MSAYFVTGTSTAVGKTFVSAALLHAATARGLRTLGIKPVASGCRRNARGQLRNEDALALIAAMSENLDYSAVNPVALEPAIAPHIAARAAGLELSVAGLAKHCRRPLARPHDLALVEGAGGWRVPLNGRECFSDLAMALNLPVILVVAMGLGCINHALLSAEAIRGDGLALAGWVANSPTGAMPEQEANLQTLRERLDAPCLGVLPAAPAGPAGAADRLALEPLIGSGTESNLPYQAGSKGSQFPAKT